MGNRVERQPPPLTGSGISQSISHETVGSFVTGDGQHDHEHNTSDKQSLSLHPYLLKILDFQSQVAMNLRGVRPLSTNQQGYSLEYKHKVYAGALPVLFSRLGFEL